MYGIVNNTTEELTTNYGKQKWKGIPKRGRIEIDNFICNETYDKVTFKLAQTASDGIQIPISDVFNTFGKCLVIKTNKEKYGMFMASGENNLKDFLINLPLFYNTLMRIHRKLTLTEFKTKDIQEKSLILHSLSKRDGLQEFVHGLLLKFGVFFNTSNYEVLIHSKNDSGAFEIFKISW